MQKQSKKINSWKSPLMFVVLLVAIAVFIAIILPTWTQNNQTDFIVWFLFTAIASLCVAMVVLAMYRSTQLTNQTPGRTLSFFNKHAFFLILFFSSLAIYGGFQMKVSVGAILTGLFLDWIRKSVLNKSSK